MRSGWAGNPVNEASGQHDEEDGNSNGEVAGNGTAVEDACSKNELNSNKETYSSTKTLLARASSK